MRKFQKKTLLLLGKLCLGFIVGFSIFFLWPKRCQSMSHIYDLFSIEKPTYWKNEEYLSLSCLTENDLKSVLQYKEDKYQKFVQAMTNHISPKTTYGINSGTKGLVQKKVSKSTKMAIS